LPDILGDPVRKAVAAVAKEARALRVTVCPESVQHFLLTGGSKEIPGV
jgi:hypothetical protein